MELRQLRYFIAVAENLNFTRAAEQLYISQPSLSQQIAELEQELGVGLFERNRRYVRLTRAGISFLDDAREILQRVDEAAKAARLMADEDSGGAGITIGIDESEDRLDRFGLPQAIAQLRADNPELRITLKQLGFDKLENALQCGAIDVGFMTLRQGETVGAQMESRVINRDRLCLGVASHITEESADCVEILRKYELHLFKSDRRWETIFSEIFQKMGVTPTIRYHERLSTIFDYVDLGAGAMIIPRHSLEIYGNPRIIALPLEGAGSELVTVAVWRHGARNPWIERLLTMLG